MVREVQLSKDQGVALVDDEDFDLVSGYAWYSTPLGYVVTVVGKEPDRTTLHMGRLIMGHPAETVDHINHDPRDNRRANLRLATREQQNANFRPQRNAKSRFKGVMESKSKTPWRATITIRARQYHLGCFGTEEDAARAYDAAAVEAWGEFAFTNAKAGLLP